MRPTVLALLLSACVLPCIVAGSRAVLPDAPLVTSLRQQQQWRRLKPQHYVIDLMWSSVWRHGEARIEVRGDPFIRGIDLTSHQPLAPATVRQLQTVASIEALFAVIALRRAASTALAASAFPAAPRVLARCLCGASAARALRCDAGLPDASLLVARTV
jgi:hypothetical protein